MKLQDKLKSIENENSIAKLVGTGVGAGLGLGISSLVDNGNPALSFGLGGLAGNLITNNLVNNRSGKYISELVFGPYAELSAEFYSNMQDLALAICNSHRDFSYLTKLSSNVDTLENCLLDDIKTETDVRITRNCFLKFYKSNIDIFEGYCKEKRANPKLINEFKVILFPIYMTIKKYLTDSAIVVESDLLYNIDTLIYVSEGFFSKSKANVKVKPDSVDLSRRNFLRSSATAAASYVAPKAIDTIESVAKGAAQTVSDAHKTYSNYNKINKFAGNPTDDLPSPSRRAFLGSFLPNEQGRRTFKRVVKASKQTIFDGAPAMADLVTNFIPGG